MNRDAWCLNSSRDGLLANMRGMIGVYNDEVARFAAIVPTFPNAKAREAFVDGFVTNDATRIKWTQDLKEALAKGQSLSFDPTRTTSSAYRPFTRQWFYFDRRLSWSAYQMPIFFPGAQATNRVISVSAKGGRSVLAP